MGDARRPYVCTGTPARITLKQLNDSITSQPEFKSLQVGEPVLQQHCHLLRLPIEIRQAIYRHVFGPSLIHIEALCYQDKSFRLAHLRCLQWQPGDSWDGHSDGRSEPYWTKKLDNPQVPNDQLLALCLSCRWMYNEALPFVLSTPLFTIDNCRRVLSIDNAKLLNFRNIRNLHLKEYYQDFPQLERPLQVSWSWTDWLIICRTLESMTKLGYLCISINLTSVDMRYRSSEELAKLTDEFLKPLKAVKISAGADGNGGSGQFDIVTKGWRVTSKLSDDVPFRVLYEEK